MSVDMRHALRHVECLANPSAMQGARWVKSIFWLKPGTSISF